MVRFDGYVRISHNKIPGRKLASGPSSIKIKEVSIKTTREASGFAVTVDPSLARIRLYCDRRMLSYDFSRYSVLDPKITNQPLPDNILFSPLLGKPLKGILAALRRNVLFACNGETDNMWATNSMMVIDGKLITRTAPGVTSKEFIALNGIFSFFVFDPDQLGIANLVLRQGQLMSAISFRSGIRGPLLLHQGRPVHGLLEQEQPNRFNNSVQWDPKTNQAAMTAVGRNQQNEIVFVSIAGEPKNENEPNLQDMVNILMQMKLTDAILLGLSGDVQQYIKMPDGRENWLVAKPRKGSSMAKMFPKGRPLSSAIIVEG